MTVVKVQPALTVTLAAGSVYEAAGANATTGTVTRDGDLSQSLVVTLSSNDTTEATVPATVTIAAGQASATFTISAVDDAIIDGTQIATIGAAAANYRSGSANLSVTDNDAPGFSSAQFDFGTATSPVGAGFRQVASTTTFSETLGYGWLSETITSADRGTAEAISRDLNLTSDGTFVVNVVNGVYTITVTMGDATKSHQ